MDGFFLEVGFVGEVDAEEEESFCDCDTLYDERYAVCCCFESIEENVQGAIAEGEGHQVV